ncbi:hypothetical protein Q2E61_03220 [Microbulbifer thermotolerans]|uniref:hypothetical protein n=1 Tax=Microbulbifer thermotolerans TaxID=252514 RepID=UPI0026727E30|nr:hypothetical protein [Microbulbifer thermotolerans]WKT61216.1 hypothetical protein Q2E61_03220 [Microbulbifer thermotolerans]
MGESQHRFKTDVNFIFGKQSVERHYILRATMHSLSVWKTRNSGIPMSPFKIKNLHVEKDAAIVDREVWVFNINGTQPQDLVTAVKVASSYYQVSPSIIFSDIYAKNLNVERENTMSDQALIRANRQLYSGVCEAIIKAAKQLGITSQLKFYVFSKNNNHKIPQKDLHASLKDGGAAQVKTDERRYKVLVGSNDDKRSLQQMTNFHMATLYT